ncbi:MAG TPA: hypothetical protein VIR16_01550 [Candidatus Limnocylindrales bacterium]
MSGGNTSIIAAYAVAKAHEPKLQDSVDVRAEQAALDEEELRELEAALYGTAAGAARDPQPVSVERVQSPGPHLLGRQR